MSRGAAELGTADDVDQLRIFQIGTPTRYIQSGQSPVQSGKTVFRNNK